MSREGGQKEEEKRERDSMLSVEPKMGLDPTTLGS